MRFARTLAVCAIGAAALLVTSGATPAKHPGRVAHTGALAAINGRIQARLARRGDAPPSDSFCRAAFLGTACYSPQEIQHAYGVDSLLNAGDTGANQTIVIIDSFAPPTLASDVATFDAGYDLPPLTSLKVLSPLGPAPPFDTSNGDMVGWSVETTLDVEWAHAMAPSAGIVVLTSNVAETEGVQGMPEFAQLIKYALDHRLGQVISQSWGATENTLFSPQGNQVLGTFEGLYARARGMHVTVLASSGDTGSTNYELNGDLYPTRVVGYPASSPSVTAVGGTSLFADTSGNYQYETVWGSPVGPYGYCGATGGGVSQTFTEPSYQRGLPGATQSALGGHRGIPDISWLADPCNGILLYLSFIPGAEGWYFIGGTSESAPQWAGLVADLDQLAGRPVGFLNPYLYALGASHVGFHDVTIGNNADLETSVPGYDAGPGWDLATGWGSPDVGSLLRGIAAMPPLD
jgi:subtilase family serine protease